MLILLSKLTDFYYLSVTWFVFIKAFTCLPHDFYIMVNALLFTTGFIKAWFAYYMIWDHWVFIYKTASFDYITVFKWTQVLEGYAWPDYEIICLSCYCQSPQHREPLNCPVGVSVVTFMIFTYCMTFNVNELS